MEKLNREQVKQYFEGKKQTWPIVMMVAGLFLIAFGVGLLMIIGGAAWFLYNKFSADHAGEAEVDRVKAYETNRARERAMKKLNILEEQVQDVAPVVVAGRGFEPESSSMVTRNNSILKRIINFNKNNIVV
jgi:hypothetical protein